MCVSLSLTSWPIKDFAFSVCQCSSNIGVIVFVYYIVGRETNVFRLSEENKKITLLNVKSNPSQTNQCSVYTEIERKR